MDAKNILNSVKEGPAFVLKTGDLPITQREKEMLDEGKNQGYKDGYKEGYKDGDKDGYLKGNEEGRLETLKALGEAVRRLDRFWDCVERDTLECVLLIARKVLNKAIDRGEYNIEETIKQATALLKDVHRLKIRVNPADMKKFSGAVNESGAEKEGGIEFVQDPAVSPGGCVVESDKGGVDARVETREREFRRVLMG